MIKTLEEFLAQSGVSNSYVRYKTASIYVKRGWAMIDGERKKALIRGKTDNSKRRSNIEINPKHKRTGLYREIDDMFVEAARKYGFDGVYVENVLNDFLPEVLVRYGYTRIDSEYGPPCFWKAV